MKVDGNTVFVHVIADYGSVGDMAFAEVRQALRYELRDKDHVIDESAVPAFDTVSTGLKLAQLAINHRMGVHQLFYVNTAPRKDDLAARGNNAGEGLVYAKLKNGVQIVAVNSGYSLAFVKEHADTIRIINCSAEGSQFRSRDVFPAAFGLIAHGDYSQLGAELKDSVPDLPQNVVCYTDGYGNLKTSLSADFVEENAGKTVSVTINDVTHRVHVGTGIFSVPDGEMVLSVGSTGWNKTDGSRLRFVECVLRGGSAAQKFNHPKGGATVTVAL